MNKVRKKFLLYAMLSLFALLTVMLAIINGVNYTMAAGDADRITQMLCDNHGTFDDTIGKAAKKKKTDVSASPDTPSQQYERPPEDGASRSMGPMGPDSPDMNSSLRYFTFVFNPDGNCGRITYRLSAVDEEDAKEWAKSLLDSASATGWTRGTYRYRIYTENKRQFVTVIDQGRELLPSYRILIISVCGEVFGLLISFLVLRVVSKKLFAPLEEADWKQRQFISNIESEFKLPLTVINADTELIERQNGSSDYTKSINRQVRKMTALVRDIGSLAIFKEESAVTTTVNLSSTLSYILDDRRHKFDERGIKLVISIEDDITIAGDDEAIRKMCAELADNALKYAVGSASFTLRRENDRILLIAENGAKLQSGSADQVFDRFTVLENADPHAIGLGLSYVRDIVKHHNGRVTAKVEDERFILTAAL